MLRNVPKASKAIFKQNGGGGCRPARPGEVGCFHLKEENAQNPLEGPDLIIAICTPHFTKYTPLCVFLLIPFQNVTDLCVLRNDTHFISGMLRNFTDYPTMLFFTSGMLRNFTDCATMLLFYFRNVAEPYGLPNDGC